MVGRLPPLTALKALESAGRHVNFSRAAEELHVTPGAISRQIRSLEAYLGVHLFDRSSAKLQLTERSTEYVTALTDAFSRIELATQRLLDNRRQRPLNIACSMTFALRWLLPRLPRFHEAHPGLELRLSMAPHPKDTFDLTDVDMAVVVSDGKRPELISERLFENELVVVGSPTLLRSKLKIKEASDLRSRPLLSSALRPDDWAHWFEAMDLADALGGSNLTTFANSSLVYQAAQAGLGFAVARFPLVLDDLISGSLVPPFPIVLVDRESYYMFHSKVTESPKLRIFRRWLQKEGERYRTEARTYSKDMSRVKQKSDR